MCPNPLLTASATQLASHIRAGDISSLQVVDAHILHIERVNPRLNAMVRDCFASARMLAEAAGKRRLCSAPEELPPLLGVPCSIKESFALKGMPNTGGLFARRNQVATDDATTVTRLKQAGAIPLGITNVSELCMWMETNNNVYGRTRNPYDLHRIVGGSSGGEGALVACGGSPFGLAADVGGSIRLPAYFCGVFGHKPTGGLIPNSGQFPSAEGVGLRYLTTGPIARRAEDLMPLVRLLAGPDGIDTECSHVTLGDPAKVKLDELDVISIPGNGSIPVSRELHEAQERCAKFLASKGARVREVRVEELRDSFEIWSAMLSSVPGSSFSELMGQGTKVRAERELLKWVFGRSTHTFPAIALGMLERLAKSLVNRRRLACQTGELLRNRLADMLGPHGVLLYPPYPTVAPRHNVPVVHPTWFVYTAIFNAMQMPVTVVPMGLGHRGLPIGVQVGAIGGSDHLTIAVAMELEKHFGGWTPPWVNARNPGDWK